MTYTPISPPFYPYCYQFFLTPGSFLTSAASSCLPGQPAFPISFFCVRNSRSRTTVLSLIVLHRISCPQTCNNIQNTPSLSYRFTSFSPSFPFASLCYTLSPPYHLHDVLRYHHSSVIHLGHGTTTIILFPHRLTLSTSCEPSS